jgi:hypothetical protein
MVGNDAGLAKSITGDRQTLLLEALYWGVRRMIENISADKERVEAAEKFLADLQTG